MFNLQLSATFVATPAGPVARVVDLTNWALATPPTRASFALFISTLRLGSLAAQDTDLEPASYEPVTFRSGVNPAGTVDVPLPGDGAYRVRAAAVPTLLDTAALGAAVIGRLYYRLDTAQFLVKVSANLTRPVLSWNDVLLATTTDPVLSNYLGDVHAFADGDARAGLARLNLKYLEAGARTRAVLLAEYGHAQLLLSGSREQFIQGFYADAATSLTATARQLGACLPGYGQSMPAIPAGCAPR